MNIKTEFFFRRVFSMLWTWRFRWSYVIWLRINEKIENWPKFSDTKVRLAINSMLNNNCFKKYGFHCENNLQKLNIFTKNKIENFTFFSQWQKCENDIVSTANVKCRSQWPSVDQVENFWSHWIRSITDWAFIDVINSMYNGDEKKKNQNPKLETIKKNCSYILFGRFSRNMKSRFHLKIAV